MAMDGAVPSEQPGKEVGTGWQLAQLPAPTAAAALGLCTAFIHSNRN
jgi:hypothetical protein